MSSAPVSPPMAPPPFAASRSRSKFVFPGSRLSATEVVAVILALAMSGGSLAIFVSGVSIWRLVLGIQDESSLEVVGRLEREAGKVRRQKVRSTEFLEIGRADELYNQDFIVTGSDSSASIALNDGGVIELGPSTLIRLSFESSLSLGGVTRGTRIELVEGEVSGQAGAGVLQVKSREGMKMLGKGERSRVKAAAAPLVLPRFSAPSLPVAPLAASIPLPAPAAPSATTAAASNAVEVVKSSLSREASLTAAIEKGKGVVRIPVSFELKGSPSEELRRNPPRLQIGTGETAAYQALRWSSSATLTTEVALSRPGVHPWRLVPGEGSDDLLQAAAGSEVALEGNWTVASEIPAIEVLAPRSGEAGLELSWKTTSPWKASSYEVAISGSAASAKPLVVLASKTPAAVVRDQAIFGRPLKIRVSSRLPGGFTAVSAPYSYDFGIAPPTLSTPQSGAEVSLKAQTKNTDGSLLVTWKRTQLTRKYEVQIARDPGFRSLVAGASVEENFYVWSSPKPGTYWWRVRGLAKGGASAFSPPNTLVLKP